MAECRDKELEEFRSLMEAPDTFEDGFSWISLLGAIFIALVMVPGAIYMGLLAGTQDVTPAARWVTVILFLEVARRAQRNLKKAEIFVLFFMASAAMGLPFGGFLWQQFLVRSDAAIGSGVAEHIPYWWAPPPDSTSYEQRTFFHVDWLPAIGLGLFGLFFGQLSNLVLGYGLFRLTSDIEKLPFPMAPVRAQGVMALAEDLEEKTQADGESSWRWRIFSIGGAIGMVFGLVYLFIPTLTGALTGNPVQILPIPFSDWTTKTQDYIPAFATGMGWNMGMLMIGMVLPFFAVLGSFIGLLITAVLNPILYNADILTSWSRGDDTIRTLFKNNVDFYFSFTIGISLAIAIAGIYQVVRSMTKKKADADAASRERSSWDASVPEGRGDIKPWAIITCYVLVTMSYITVSGILIDWHPGVMAVLLFFGFVYTPMISYVTARLEGIAGQVVAIPMIKEASLILSGYQGAKVWFLPIPMSNFGNMTVFYRECELTGTKFTSIWKTKLILFPIIIVSGLFFYNFIWGLAEVPSAVYPYANKLWELNAANQCIMYSSTLDEFSIFERAFRPLYLLIGTGFGILLFGVLSHFGAPIFLVYGVVRGLGQTMPHGVIPEFIGALIGRYYFQRKLGKQWRQYVPVLSAGFMCGMGLIAMVGVGITFLSKSVIQLPY